MRLFSLMYANQLGNLTVEKTVKESLAILEENLVVAGMCNRDFEDEFADFGEVVNYNIINEGTADRLAEDDEMTVNDVSATGGQVKLNQHLTSAFYITDRQEQRSFADLVETFVQPHARALAEKVDRIVSGETYQFLGNSAGQLFVDPTYNTLVDANTVMNDNNMPLIDRPMAVGPAAQGALLKEGKLTETATAGDGSPIINGWIGKGSGFQLGMSQTIPNVLDGDHRVGAVNNVGGYPRGATTIAVDGFTGAGTDGSYCTIAGVPYRCTSVNESVSDVDSLVIEGGLREAVADDAEVKLFSEGLAVNNVGGYATGWVKGILYDGQTIHPQVGQGVSFGSASPVYGIIKVDTASNTLWVNRPLDAAITDDEPINITPGGRYNWGFTKGAVALVNRPMAPASGGVESAIASYGNLALRIIKSYEHKRQRSLVSLDLLMGVKTIDTQRGVLLYG